ncbi:TRM11 family SAM-dependent methyltransferase [Plantactinospora sp. WMMC1484]|uniref:TRM11 family SAM-dependent methyltransferase n=1 Tax=Plantactinospora sp. WMMC1484 TaxID=3404122 RepID=UPI003BF4CEEA
MSQYALLISPSANRVYADASVRLTRAELAVVDRTVLGGRLSGVTETVLGGVRYVTFTADGGLGEREVEYLANLSSIYVLFEVVQGLLRPVELRPLARYDDDLLTIPKYPGKTNEQFTKLLLNITLLSSRFAPEMLDRQLRVLDPLCGRGTTLNQALMYGYDAAGVEHDRTDFEAYSTYVQTWLKRKRLKHRVESGPVRRDRQVVARRLQVNLAADKESYRAGRTQRLDVVQVDTLRSGEFFRSGSQDLLVADAPYGVQHGSRSAGRGLARSPLALLTEAVPVWVELLRPGGALGIAWNTNVARREEAAAVLADAGLEVLADGPYLEFGHRVDQAIVRDILIARKP